MQAVFDSPWYSWLFPVFLIGALALGFRLAGKYYKTKQKSWVASGVESSLIGFFALIISFTLLSSNNELKRRATLVHEETDTMGDMIRISSLMKPAIRDTVLKFTIDYTKSKLEFADGKIAEGSWERDAEIILDNFLKFLAHAEDSVHASEHHQDLLMTKFNNLSGTFYRLKYSYSERTPFIIMLLLYLASILVALLVGFMNGFPEKRHYLVPIIYAVLTLFTLEAIRDLDDPLHGNIRPSYNISKDFLESIEK